MGTVIDDKQRGHEDRHPRWDRLQRAELLGHYRDVHAEGLSQRQAAQRLEGPRTTLHAWRAWQDRLDACPQVVACFASVPGLACLHRLVLACHVVCVDMGAGGMRLVCLLLQRTGRNRFVDASCGTQQRIHRRVEEALGAYTQTEPPRLAQHMTPQDITVTQDETFTGGLGLGAIEPVSHSILLEHNAEARDHATWSELMRGALTHLQGTVIQSTRDEAPGLLASVAHHLGAPHAPDVCHVQHALSKAVAAPMAAPQHAADKAVATAEEVLQQAPAQSLHAHPERRGPGRPPQAAPSLEQARQAVEAARHEPQRLTPAREQVGHRWRAIGHASHCVDLERGVRRNGQLMASDRQPQIETMRTIAQHAGLRESCLDRLAKAARVGPTMPATIACVSG